MASAAVASQSRTPGLLTDYGFSQRQLEESMATTNGLPFFDHAYPAYQPLQHTTTISQTHPSSSRATDDYTPSTLATTADLLLPLGIGVSTSSGGSAGGAVGDLGTISSNFEFPQVPQALLQGAPEFEYSAHTTAAVFPDALLDGSSLGYELSQANATGSDPSIGRNGWFGQAQQQQHAYVNGHNSSQQQPFQWAYHDDAAAAYAQTPSNSNGHALARSMSQQEQQQSFVSSQTSEQFAQATRQVAPSSKGYGSTASSSSLEMAHPSHSQSFSTTGSLYYGSPATSYRGSLDQPRVKRSKRDSQQASLAAVSPPPTSSSSGLTSAHPEPVYSVPRTLSQPAAALSIARAQVEKANGSEQCAQPPYHHQPFTHHQQVQQHSRQQTYPPADWNSGGGGSHSRPGNPAAFSRPLVASQNGLGYYSHSTMLYQPSGPELMPSSNGHDVDTKPPRPPRARQHSSQGSTDEDESEAPPPNPRAVALAAAATKGQPGTQAQQDLLQQLNETMNTSLETEGVARCPFDNCTKTFAKNRSYNLKTHLRSHSQLKPFACQSCPRAFSRKHDLERHARVHSGDKPYICEACGRGFPRSDALRRHWRVEKECGERAAEVEAGHALPSVAPTSSSLLAASKIPGGPPGTGMPSVYSGSWDPSEHQQQQHMSRKRGREEGW